MVRLHRLVAPLIAAALLVGMSGTALAAEKADVRVLPRLARRTRRRHLSRRHHRRCPDQRPLRDDLRLSPSYPPRPQHQGLRPGTTADPVIDADVTVAAGAAYTIAATGALADITAQVLQDQPSPSASTAQVRVVHFSADATPSISRRPVPVDEAVVKGLEYPNATDYLALPGGTYDLEVRLAGETTVALALPNVTIQDGRAYSVFVVGSAAPHRLSGATPSRPWSRSTRRQPRQPPFRRRTRS